MPPRIDAVKTKEICCPIDKREIRRTHTHARVLCPCFPSMKARVGEHFLVTRMDYLDATLFCVIN